jgi:hypothetical protein
MRTSGTATRGDVLAITRVGVAALFVLAVANGLFLYGVPARAATDYAWAIRPPINGALLGAGYLAGAVGTALSLRAERWRSMRILAASLVTLAVALLAATALHADRFRWGYPPTWGWVVVYATVPLAAVALWRAQERLVPAPAADPRLATQRRLSLVLGALLAVVGAALLLAPGALADAWPWPLTPLMARAAAGWCLLVASALLIAARSLRRRHEAVVPYAALLTWAVLLLALPVLHGDDLLAGRGAGLAILLAIESALAALSGYALYLARGERI